MESGAVRVVAVPTAHARPYAIVVDPDGRPWVALFGTHALATVDPESFAISEIELPREDARPRRIGRTRDGRLWYVDYAQGYLGAYAPAERSFREWRRRCAPRRVPARCRLVRHRHRRDRPGAAARVSRRPAGSHDAQGGSGSPCAARKPAS
jgi:streptogramin lyase